MRNIRFNFHVVTIVYIIYLIAREYRRCCRKKFHDFYYIVARVESIESINV